MSDKEPISAAEFERAINLINGSINRGFSGVHKRFDRVEDTQTEHAERIAVLESTVKIAAASAAKEAVSEHVSRKRKTWAGYGVAAGTFIAGIFEVFRQLSK